MEEKERPIYALFVIGVYGLSHEVFNTDPILENIRVSLAGILQSATFFVVVAETVVAAF